ALPLFSRTACPCPERTRSISRRTGAALTLLVVNTPAAAAGTRDTTRARSFFCALIPQCTPAAAKPCADVTPPWIKRVTPSAIAPPPLPLLQPLHAIGSTLVWSPRRGQCPFDRRPGL